MPWWLIYIKGCTEINLHDPSLLLTLQCTSQCIGHARKCITGTLTFQISKLGGWKRPLGSINRPRQTDTCRSNTLELRQYWCYGNRSDSSVREGRWTFRNWGDIGLSPACLKTTLTIKPPKHYTKTAGHNINSSLKKKRKRTPWISENIRVKV